MRHVLMTTDRHDANLPDLFPWEEEAAIDAILDHPTAGHTSVASQRA